MLQSARSTLQVLASNPLAIVVLAVTLFAVNLACWFPGHGTPDSDYQYQQAISHHYTDWHPPVMAWVWSCIRFFGEGTWPIFTLQIGLYWLGFSLVALALRRAGRWRSAWAALLIASLPPLIMLDIVVMKDIVLAGALLVMFGLVFRYRGTDRPVPATVIVPALILLAFGALLRVNAVFAVPPLLAYLVYPRLTARPVRLVILSLIVSVVLVPVSSLVNRDLFRASPTYPIRSLQIFDLAGIAHFGRDASVFGVADKISQEQVDTCYTPVFWDTLGPARRCEAFFYQIALHAPSLHLAAEDAYLIDPGPNNDRLLRLWKQAIADHPFAYALHRLAHLNSEMDFIEPAHHADVIVQHAYTSGDPVVSPSWSPAKKGFDLVRNNVFTAPVFLIVAGAELWLVLLSSPLVFTPRRRLAGVTLTSSGLLYAFAYLVIGVATDPRYEFWSFISVLVAFLVTLPDIGPWFRTAGLGKWVYTAILAATVSITLGSRLVLGDALSPT